MYNIQRCVLLEVFCDLFPLLCIAERVGYSYRSSIKLTKHCYYEKKKPALLCAI